MYQLSRPAKKIAGAVVRALVSHQIDYGFESRTYGDLRFKRLTIAPDLGTWQSEAISRWISIYGYIHLVVDCGQ